jgi:hypothetical protein
MWTGNRGRAGVFRSRCIHALRSIVSTSPEPRQNGTRPRAPVWPARLRALRAWIVLSAGGIAWGFAHLALEAPLGAGGTNLWRLVLVSTFVWLAVLFLAVRGSRRAALVAVLLGATVCFQLALVHFARVGSHTIWLGPVPWMTDPEDAPKALVPPYNLLMYAGVGLGLGTIWAGTRALVSGDRLQNLWFPFLVAGLVFVTGLVDMTRPASYAGGTGFFWTAAAAMAAGAVAMAAALMPHRSPGTPAD